MGCDMTKLNSITTYTPPVKIKKMEFVLNRTYVADPHILIS